MSTIHYKCRITWRTPGNNVHQRENNSSGVLGKNSSKNHTNNSEHTKRVTRRALHLGQGGICHHHHHHHKYKLIKLLKTTYKMQPENVCTKWAISPPLIRSTAAACNIIRGDRFFFKKIQCIEIINVLFTENQTDQKY